MKEIEKITLILSENDKELKNKIEELGCDIQEYKSEFFNGDVYTYTLLISITRDIVVPLAYIIVSAMSKYKKSKFKYNGIELEGYSAEEIEKILTVIAQKNDLLKGNSKKGNV